MKPPMQLGNDLFPETFVSPCEIFRAVLADEMLIPKIAATRILFEFADRLRGDGRKAGWSIITHSLPMLFRLEIAHDHSRIIAELAGIVPPEKTHGVNYTPPDEAEIAKALPSMLSAFSERLGIVSGLAQGMDSLPKYYRHSF